MRQRLLPLLWVATASAFYLPGVAPHEYLGGEPVEIKVNKMSSTLTQLPYDYYSLPFCKPPSLSSKVENLGEVLHGSKIQNTVFNLKMGVAQPAIACRQIWTKKDLANLAKRIRQEYRVHLIMDNLPSATRMISELADGKQVIMYDRGYRIGFAGSASIPNSRIGVVYLNNHLKFIVKIHKDPSSYVGSRIVGFEVETYSVKHSYKGEFNSGTMVDTLPIRPDSELQAVDEMSETQEIIFSYETVYEDSDISWASRWDLYLYMGDDQIHWFSILNSLAIVLLLSGIVAMIMMRTLRRDLNRYNSVEEKEEMAEESGWKLVHGDVLRPPAFPLLLSVSVGTGTQLLGMAIVSIGCAMLGFLSPANRGGLLTATLLLFTLMGFPAGYCASVLYKSLRGAEWKLLTLMTATFYPGVVFFIYFVLNFFIWSRGSSAAIPFGTFVALLLMWFFISFPLVFVGAFFGFKQPLAEPPVRTNEIPRQIPEQEWYMSSAFTMLIGGILPFGAVFIELFFIMSSVWLQRFYYVFGFLALVLVILIITCAEISIVLAYFQLCNEDYQWWWRSFFNSASAGIYLFAYSIVYFRTQLEIEEFVPTLLYYGYMAMISIIFCLVTGAIGLLSSWLFVWQIYGAVKVD